MRKLFGIFITLLATYSPALAGLTPIDLAQLQVQNILVNPGFENGSYGWTASGGATAQANSTARGIGSFGYNWDSNSASQTLLSNLVTIPESLKGRNGLAYCSIKTPSGTATHTITVSDGSNDLVTAQTITSSTSFARVNVNFIFPSSGSVRIKMTSVASNEPAIYIDDCFLGDATANIISTSVDTAWTSFTPTITHGSGGMTYATSSGYWRRTGDSIEMVGQTTFSNTSAAFGEYRINLPSGLTIDANKIPSTTSFVLPMGYGHIYDSGSRVQVGSVFYRTSTLLELRITQTESGTNPVNTSQNSITNTVPITFGASDTISWRIVAPISGWSTSATLYNAAVQNWKVDANISGANPSLGTSSVSSYTGIENGSLTLTNNSGSGNITAQIPCSSTNSPSGTTCSAGSESVGVSFNLPAAGDVMACVSFTHGLTNSGSSDVFSTFQIVETPSNAQTISQEGKSRVSSGNDAFSRIQSTPYRVCGTFSFSSAGQKTLRLMYEQAVTNTPTTNVIYGDASTSNGQRDIHWEVYPINQQMPAPILVGSVSSNTSGQERIERLLFSGGSSTTVCSSSPCTIVTQTGSFATGVTRGSTGNYVMTIASGIFSAAPQCTCSSQGVATNYNGCSARGVSATSVNIYNGSGATPQDDAINIICMGPR